jgi:hypothetical protein
MGQTPQGGVTQTVYTKTPALKEYVAHFDKINFDSSFDIKIIRRWNKHDFYLSQLTTQHARKQTDTIYKAEETAKGTAAKKHVEQDLSKEKVVVSAKAPKQKLQQVRK